MNNVKPKPRVAVKNDDEQDERDLATLRIDVPDATMPTAASAAVAELDPGPTRRARLPHVSGRWWTPMKLEELRGPRMHAVFSARARLYLYLRIHSWRGTRPVHLTNAMAAEVGLRKQNKMRELRVLETLGLVSVARVGNAAPIVTVLGLG